jgi:hypothetical protein
LRKCPVSLARGLILGVACTPAKLLAATEWPADAATPPPPATFIAAPPCMPEGPYDPICGLQAPEDLHVLPGGGRLLVSQMSGPAHLPDNNIAELDLATRRTRVLPVVQEERVAWADASCTVPDPGHDVHGFDLSRTATGDQQLLVVNHGSRESIEIFHLVGPPTDRRLEWRGCVVTPADVRLNDVAALPGGGFVATVMGNTQHFGTQEGFTFLMSGADTGYLLEWTPGDGFRRLPGSDAPFPNGVVVDAAGKTAWMASFAGRKLVRYDLGADRASGEVALDFMPDNLSWSPDHSVLAAGILAVEDVTHCLDGRTPFCTSRFRVARTDPATLSVQRVADGPSGLLGGASVAVQDGDWLYIGAWAGDRILRLPIAKP